jgi:hypothetical protein
MLTWTVHSRGRKEHDKDSADAATKGGKQDKRNGREGRDGEMLSWRKFEGKNADKAVSEKDNIGNATTCDFAFTQLFTRCRPA